MNITSFQRENMNYTMCVGDVIMATVKDCPGFETFGEDVRDGREAQGMTRYFNPALIQENSEVRQRVRHKMQLCPEKYLPIVEATLDGAIRMKE